MRQCSRGALRVAALLVVVLLGGAGCGDGDPGAGPGPVGPVGPVDPADDGEGIAGSGTIVVESREVVGFDRIVHAGEGDIVITSGGAESLTVRTDDNLLDVIETTVEDGSLRIVTSAIEDIEPTQPIRYEIEVDELRSIELVGAGSIRIDEWTAGMPTISLSGVGDIHVGAIDSESLVVEHTGVGSVAVAGSVVAQEVLLTGVGEYAAPDLESDRAEIDAGGLASATIWVKSSLMVIVSDSAEVAYYGTPEVAGSMWWVI